MQVLCRNVAFGPERHGPHSGDYFRRRRHRGAIRRRGGKPDGTVELSRRRHFVHLHALAALRRGSRKSSGTHFVHACPVLPVAPVTRIFGCSINNPLIESSPFALLDVYTSIGPQQFHDAAFVLRRTNSFMLFHPTSPSFRRSLCSADSQYG